MLYHFPAPPVSSHIVSHPFYVDVSFLFFFLSFSSPFGFVLLLVLLASCCDDILDGMLFFSSPFPSFCKCVQIAMGSKNYVIAGQERGKAGCATCAPEQIVLGR